MKSLIFFQGGGSNEDYDADSKLVASLRRNLGTEFTIHYPLLERNQTADFGRRKQIVGEISRSREGVVLVAHSLGASMLLACFSEQAIHKTISGIFLLATPFWSGDENWVKPLKLQPDFAKRLDPKIPLHFYHCHDDEEVPFDHMAIYQQHLPWASFHEIDFGGHQFNNDLTIVAEDIVKLRL